VITEINTDITTTTRSKHKSVMLIEREQQNVHDRQWQQLRNYCYCYHHIICTSELRNDV